MMARSTKILLVIAALIITIVTVTGMIFKKDINPDEVTKVCPRSGMRGAPTITDYGNDFVVLQTLKQKNLRVGQSYEFGDIVTSSSHEVKMKVVLVRDDNQKNYIVTIEEMYIPLYESGAEQWIKYDCKQLVDMSQKSLLSDMSSLFVNFDSAEWVISDAIEMVSNSENFQSNAIYHYHIYIEGKSKNVSINSASFNVAVALRSFSTVEDAQRYYQIRNDMLQGYAYYGSIESAINIRASKHESYCNHPPSFIDETGCYFIGRSNDVIVEIYLFPQSERADIGQVELYWPEFVQNLWPSVLESYGSISTMP